MSLTEISEIVKMLGLVSAGIWAAWTFHELKRVRAAELENNQKLSQIQKSRIEQEEIRARLLRQQPQLALQINVSEAGSSMEACQSSLCVAVVLQNEGEQNLQVSFDSSALTVGRILIRKDGSQKIVDVRRFGPTYFEANGDNLRMFQERIIRAGQKRQMALVYSGELIRGLGTRVRRGATGQMIGLAW